MDILIDFLRVIHVITAILMAWPFYALVSVNQRARLGPPLGDRVDIYMENIIKNRTIPCFVFQATVLLTGLALMLLQGFTLSDLMTNAALGLKFLMILLIGGLLTYVHTSLQPRIDALFAQAGGDTVSPEAAPIIGALRLQRKRFASICLFVVLIEAMLGLQVWASFPIWQTVILVISIATFTFWSYKSTTPYGWF